MINGSQPTKRPITNEAPISEPNIHQNLNQSKQQPPTSLIAAHIFPASPPKQNNGTSPRHAKWTKIPRAMTRHGNLQPGLRMPCLWSKPSLCTSTSAQIVPTTTQCRQTRAKSRTPRPTELWGTARTSLWPSVSCPFPLTPDGLQPWRGGRGPPENIEITARPHHRLQMPLVARRNCGETEYIHVHIPGPWHPASQPV